MGLSPEHKLAWLFLCDQCDSVGVWECNIKLADFMIGVEVNWGEFLNACGDRVLKMENGKLWLRSFCRFQHPDLNPDSKAKPIQKYIKELKKHSLWEPYLKGMDTVSDGVSMPSKEREREREREREQGGVGGNPGARPKDLSECIEKAKQIGMPESDARAWYRDMEAAGWRRADGTKLGNWVSTMARVREGYREKRARLGHDKVVTQSAADKRMAELDRKAAAL